MYAYSPDAIQIAYEVTGQGEPTLVFVHGWSCDRSYWEAQIKHFGQRHRVVALDLAGHGESGLDRAEWTIQGFASDVIAVLEQLDIGTGVLIGHSMGGPVVLEVGIRAPNRVLCVIGVDTFLDGWASLDPEPFKTNFIETTTTLVSNMFTPESDRNLVERIAADMASGPSTVGIEAWIALREWANDDLDRAFREILTPVRMIQAERTPDDLTHVRGHAAYLTSFDIAVIQQAGHFVMIEQSETFNRVLGDFIDGLQQPV